MKDNYHPLMPCNVFRLWKLKPRLSKSQLDCLALRSHTCRSVRPDRHDYEHRSRGKWCARKRRRLKSRLQKSEEEIPKIGLWIRLTRKQSAKRRSTRQLPTPFLPAMRHRPCRIQAKILSRSRHLKGISVFEMGTVWRARLEVIPPL